MKKLTLSLIALSLLSQTMLAELVCDKNQLAPIQTDSRYIFAGGSQESGVMYYDTKTIKIDKKNKIISVWTADIQTPIGRNMFAKNDPKYLNYGFEKRLRELDYKNNTEVIKAFIASNCDSSIIESNQNTNWKKQDIVPGSVAEALLEEIKQKYNLK